MVGGKGPGAKYPLAMVNFILDIFDDDQELGFDKTTK
jgi:hypothetical protein